MSMIGRRLAGFFASLTLLFSAAVVADTQKPILHGKHWVAITGKPLGASAGARIFYQGGNAVDATCAMLAATSTMWDVLGWGGETQALIYNPHTGKVVGINALGVAPTGATPEFFAGKGMAYPPEYGPLAAVTPGTPGGLMVMLAEFGTLSLEDVLAPAIEMAEGYPIEESAAGSIEYYKDQPALRSRFSNLLTELTEEFGEQAEHFATVAGPFVLEKIREEEKRLENGWTYEPPTFYEKNDAWLEMENQDSSPVVA